MELITISLYFKYSDFDLNMITIKSEGILIILN